MVDGDPGSYRPRRAWVEPEPADEPVAPTPTASPAATPDPPAAATSPAAATPPASTTPTGPATPPSATVDDLPKPLFREEADAPTAVHRPVARAAADSGPDTGATRPITFAPRRPRPADDDATTILPRTARGRRSAVDELDDDAEKSSLSQRTKMALLIGALAAVVVIGLAIGYAVLRTGTPVTTPSADPSVVASTAPPTSTAPSATPSSAGPVEVLSDVSMVNEADAAAIADRTWKVASTERGTSEDEEQPACFTPEPAEGQPTPQQKIVRELTSSGKNAPGALHVATAYATPEDAVQAYAVAAKVLGGCEVTGSYIVSGQAVSGLGDQSTGVVVATVDGADQRLHTVLLNRTGRVLNIFDATQPDKALSADKVADALALATARACGPAGGACPAKVAVGDGPPPLGGDEPGFLATGDLPPASKAALPWVSVPPELPKDNFVGSGCETVNWATLSSEATTSRVYLQQDSGNFFGLNEIIVTLKDDSAANKLAEKIKSDLESCAERKLTAKVSKPKAVEGIGARKAEVQGWTAEVTQRAGETSTRYRVGVVASGDKVAYTFLNPQDGFDFNDTQFDTVAARAGERMTQVN